MMLTTFLNVTIYNYMVMPASYQNKTWLRTQLNQEFIINEQKNTTFCQ